MSKIPPFLIPPTNLSQDARNKLQNQIAETGNFDALLFSKESNPLSSFIDEFLGSITGAQNTDVSAVLPQAITNNTFPFSSAFESTFGLSGPLPAFITRMTAKLHLSAAQNQSFQQIAVNNKDATKTAESVAKIAAELKTAGIGY